MEEVAVLMVAVLLVSVTMVKMVKMAEGLELVVVVALLHKSRKIKPLIIFLKGEARHNFPAPPSPHFFF